MNNQNNEYTLIQQKPRKVISWKIFSKTDRLLEIINGPTVVVRFLGDGFDPDISPKILEPIYDDESI